jgi:hypothetical protein
MCINYKVCLQHFAASKRLITTLLTMAWEMHFSNDRCSFALKALGALMSATASKFCRWFGQHADLLAGE